MVTELVITQHIARPLEQVWDDWTTADAWARWWWPHWEDTRYVVDARPGGQYLARSEQGGTGVSGEFVSVDRPHRLELTWCWDGEDQQDRVLVELSEEDGGTLVTVRHRTEAEGADDYRQGWQFVLGNLAEASHVTAPQPLAEAVSERIALLAGPSLMLTQRVRSSAGEVFDAWVDPERLATWWWPHLPDATYEVDAREGGTFRFRSQSGGIGAHGTYLVISRPTYLAMTWHWETGEHSSPEDVVEVRFLEAAGGSEVVVELAHHIAGAGEDTSNPRRGWADVLSRLG